MVTKYKFVNYEFNFDFWAMNMRLIVERGDAPVVAELMGISESIIVNWGKGRWTEGFKYPNMTNFLKMCNFLEIEPLQFFTTSE